MSDERCPHADFGMECELPAGHRGRHQATIPAHVFKWATPKCRVRSLGDPCTLPLRHEGPCKFRRATVSP